MTKEEYLQAIEDKESQIKTLNSQIAELKQMLIKEHSEYGVGDKVRVCNGGCHKEVFISKVRVNWNNEIEYSFNKVKKDGTMSGQSASIYWTNKIELIEKSKP
jgi:hypothetical protein